MFLVWFVFFVLLYGVIVFGGLIVIIHFLGKAQKIWSLIGTGKYRMVQRGETVIDVIHNVRGYHLDDHKRFKKGGTYIGLVEKLSAAQFMGFPFYSIKTYKDWSWEEFGRLNSTLEASQPIEPKYGSISRVKDVNEFFYQFTHSVDLDDVELGGGPFGQNIRAKMRVLVTIWVLEPIKFHEGNKDPVSVLYSRVRACARGWAGGKDFDEIKRTLDTGGQPSDFSENFKKLNGVELLNGDPDYSHIEEDSLFDILGVVIIQSSLEDFGAVGDAIKALEAERLANLQGQAGVATARKEAEARVIRAQAEFDAAKLEAAAIRAMNEQDAGYYASLPGGARMFVASRVAAKDSDITTWVEGGSDVKPTLPLPAAPPPPKPSNKST